MSLTLLFAGPGVITGGGGPPTYIYYWNGAFWYRKAAISGLSSESRALTLFTNDIPGNILSYSSQSRTVAEVLNRSLGV